MPSDRLPLFEGVSLGTRLIIGFLLGAAKLEALSSVGGGRWYGKYKIRSRPT